MTACGYTEKDGPLNVCDIYIYIYMDAVDDHIGFCAKTALMRLKMDVA